MNQFKVYCVAFAVSLAAASGVQAQSGGMKGMEMKDMKDMKAGKQGQVHKAAGTVQKIDPAKGTVTFAHGPVKTMNWPAMTMTFKVKDKAMLEKIKQGAKVELACGCPEIKRRPRTGFNQDKCLGLTTDFTDRELKIK